MNEEMIKINEAASYIRAHYHDSARDCHYF